MRKIPLLIGAVLVADETQRGFFAELHFRLAVDANLDDILEGGNDFAFDIDDDHVGDRETQESDHAVEFVFLYERAVEVCTE